MKFFQYNSVAIEYNIYPAAKVTSWWRKLRRLPTSAIFLHGINDPFQNHEDLFLPLQQKGLTVHALNFPGHADSEQVPTISWKLLTAIVDAYVAMQELSNVIIIGYSMGGGVALQLANDHHRWINKLLLLAPFCDRVHWQDAPHSALGVVEYMRYFHEQTLKFPLKPKPVLTDAKYIFSHYGHLFANFPLDLVDCKLPIDVILHEHDTVINNRRATEFLATIPCAKIVQVANVTHDLYYLTPQQLHHYQQLLKMYV